MKVRLRAVMPLPPPATGRLTVMSSSVLVGPTTRDAKLRKDAR
ncbi:MAG: hypothetical protein AAF447_09250 [Myxococcota bacterium]